LEFEVQTGLLWMNSLSTKKHKRKPVFPHMVNCDEIALQKNPAPERNQGLTHTQMDAILNKI
jgi:hypothetical protein